MAFEALAMICVLPLAIMMESLFITYLHEVLAFPSDQELLALEERIGSVSTALSDEQFAKCLRRSIYCPVATGVNKSVIDDIKCSICQVLCDQYFSVV